MIVDVELQTLLRAHLSTTEQRFDKLEAKIDSLSDVVISLARAETKLIGLEESRQEQGKRIGALELTIQELKEESNDNTDFRRAIARAAWIIITAAITIGVGLYLK
jgi:DNA repair exonuclease SbcCD ATPase subunit